MKNAIDWTVGTEEFVNKPVALITASSSGERGHAALLLVLEAVSANVISDATFIISSIRAKINESGIPKDLELQHKITSAVQSMTDVAKKLTESR